MSGMVGGFGGVKPADADIDAIVNKAEVLASLSSTIGSPVTSVEVVGYKTQVVAGVNYKIHAKLNGADYVVVVYRPLGEGATLEVTKVTPGSEL